MTQFLFEWDHEKADANLKKHRVDFASAAQVFVDPFAIETLDPRSYADGEIRTLITGMIEVNLLTVVFVERNETIRIISARRATRREHDDYYIQNSNL